MRPILSIFHIAGNLVKLLGNKALELTGALTGTSATFSGSVSAGLISGSHQAVTASGATTAINLASGQNVTLTLGVATTAVSFTNVPYPATGTITIVQDGVGGRLATWPATARWPFGQAQSLSTAAAAVDVIIWKTTTGAAMDLFLAGAELAVPA